jgi:anti-sigma regulatory factor (Ser/Thr protein kinase)
VSTSEERTLAEVFVDLSDTLVADYDVVDFLHLLAARCVDLLGVRAAGIMVGDQRGGLRVMASSSEQAQVLAVFEAEADGGPGVDCLATGSPVTDPDLGAPHPRWARFAERAHQAGFRATYAIPVRLRDEVIGVLSLLAAAPGQLAERTMRTARALANIVTVGLLQHRAVGYRQMLVEQLQHAMHSRVVIEQAKGVLAEHLGLDMAAAFDELRGFSSRIGRRLSDVAAAVAAGDFGPPATAGTGLRMLLIRYFDLETLARVRTAVRMVSVRQGVPDPQAYQFVQAVHEAAANAIRHGGGRGHLLVWRAAGDLAAEITDHGPGFPEAERLIASDPGDFHDGRGLWLINRVCAGLDIETGAHGTRLTLRYPLDSPVAFTRFG